MATTSRLSHSPYLRIAASVFGTIFLGFGINAMLRPANALEFFEFEAPASAADKKLVDSLMVIYGARDLFMGLAIHAAAYFGDRRALGWIVVAASGVAFVDGAVCRMNVSKGEWNHWGYAPVLTVVGSMLLGVLDGAWGTAVAVIHATAEYCMSWSVRTSPTCTRDMRFRSEADGLEQFKAFPIVITADAIR